MLALAECHNHNHSNLVQDALQQQPQPSTGRSVSAHLSLVGNTYVSILVEATDL